jgi:pimeloyl-ACP methyl ester carboxylesterase
MAEEFVRVNGVEICYETIGDPTGRPLVLIMGLSGPMTWWDDEFCELLAERGFFVIRLDNRDCGRSSKMSGRANLLRCYLGLDQAPYSLVDMANDVAGLLDHLRIPAAHVYGVSMGGMIAQTLAIEHPDRVLSLVSMMSTTGNRLFGVPQPRAFRNLLIRPPRTLDEYIKLADRVAEVIRSPGYPADPERALKRAHVTWQRGLNPSGTARQMAAIITAPDRTKQLGRLKIPVTVVHGTKDPLVRTVAGRATARAVPGAELVLVPGMAHDLPLRLWPHFADIVERTADRAVAERDRFARAASRLDSPAEVHGESQR